MEIKHIRIDDRLIHGQIITAWLRAAEADTIVVIDDIANNDPTQKMLLEFATPKSIKLIIVSVEESYDKLNNATGKSLVLVRTPKNALSIKKLGLDFDSVNVGNISNTSKGGVRKTLQPYLHVSQEDIESLLELNSLGVELDVRSVPTDRKYNILERIK